MKKADNFDASKWLIENKITTQSRLNENKTLGPYDFDTFKWKNQPSNPNAKLEDLENEDTVSKGDFWKSDIIGNDSSTPTYGSENNGVWTFAWDSGEISGFIEGEDFTLSNLNENELNPITKKKFDNLIAMVEKAVANKDQETLYKIYNKGLNTGSKGWGYFIDSLVDKGLARVDDRRMLKFNLNESKLNENKIPGVDVEVDDDMVTLSGDSGDYDGFIEGNGTVSFSVTNDEEDFNDQNWKDILGDDHVFVKIANAINTDVEALGDYVQITVKADDLTSMNESKLNEDLTDEIAALPDFNTAMDREKSELIVGKYAVVRYDESDEGGENMYVVWDNTVNQDEIGSYDDVPEFESEDPAEVAAFLKKNESLNEVDMQNMSSAYPQYDRFEFRKFKDNLEMKVYENYPLTGNIKSQLPKNLIQVSPDNIETDWAKIDYTIIKGNNNMTVRLDYPMYIHLYYDTKDIKDLYEKTADEAGFKYKESPNQGVITLLFSK